MSLLHSDLEKILKEDITDTLTDFIHNQIVFWDTFEKDKIKSTPIKNVLELGVYRLIDEPNSKYPGQSTKTLFTLCDYYNVDKFISLDIDNCLSTINNCVNWVQQRNVTIKNHKFIQSNSVHFNIESEFQNGIDLIFLDTNHDDNYPERIGYENAGGAGMTYKEICYYAPHISKNGHMFIHDTKNIYVEEGLGKNTSGAIEKFIMENPEFDFYEHNTNAHGLGEIFRK